MNQRTATIRPEYLTVVPDLESTCPPWCIINHADPIYSLDCHIADANWDTGLGLSLGDSSDAPLAIVVMWDHANALQQLDWSPAQARQAAAELLRLAEIVESATGIKARA